MVIEKILAATTAKANKHDYAPDDFLGNIGSGLQAATLQKLETYFDRIGIQYTVTRADYKIEIRFGYCPMRGPQHSDGAAIVYINPDGSHAFHCKHAKCADKTFEDLEAIHGPLSPVIRIGADIERLIVDSERIIADTDICQRGNLLTVITHDSPNPPLCLVSTAAPRARVVLKTMLAEKMSAAARYEKWSERKKDYVRCAPPDSIMIALIERGYYPSVPAINGIVSAPVLLRDGSLLLTPGFHKASGLYLESDASYPSLMKVSEATALLLDTISDFPLSDIHRAAWITSLLTLFARHAFGGSAPLNLIDANTRGAGKGLLCDVVSMIFEGRPAGKCAVPCHDDEWRKLISTLAIQAAPLVVLDNAVGKFGGPSLDRALTADRWQDRLLGSNRHIDVPLQIVWFATSNNATLSTDTIRRSLHIRLESPLEKPEERSDFRHKNLLQHVKQERPRLVMAALSILNAYHAAGRPSQNLTPWGSFEPWSDLVRSAVVWVGLPDPAETRSKLADEDNETMLLAQLIEGWSELGFPATVSAALELLDNAPDKYDTLRAAVNELTVGKFNDRHKIIQYLLREAKGRVIDGRCFARSDNKVAKWTVVTL